MTLGEDDSGLPAVETSGYARAVLNMLEDLSEERERMGDGQRALVNILEDSYEERTRLQDTQAAVLNILEDLQGEQEEIRRLNAQLEDRVRERTEDLLQRSAELKAANQELEAFAYSLAHDLRTPIRAISAFGAVLARNHGDQLGDQGRQTLERIRRASAQNGRADRRDAAARPAHPTRAVLHERGSQRGGQGDQRRATRSGSGAHG